MPLDLQQYRADAEQFARRARHEAYRHFSGLKPVCDTAAVYERHPELVHANARCTSSTACTPQARDDEKRRLAYLLAFAVEEYLDAETRHLGDEIANTESRTTIVVDGEDINLRAAPVALANEADRERRQRIDDARLAAIVEHLNPLLDRQWRRCHELSRGLGRESYLDLFGEVKGIDYFALRAKTDAFLHDTAGLYERSMDRLARERLGLPLAELRYADLPYLWRAPSYDDVFTADGLVPTLERTLADMGVDLAAQANVHLDTEVRENKTPRAFCAPVRVPGEIYLVVLPHGGQDDYAALLHEAGHTEHFAHVAAGPPLRVPASRRQRRHRGVRLPVRPPRAQPGVARTEPGVRRQRGVRALRHDLRSVLPAPLRGQARLRDRVPRAVGVARRDVGRLSAAPQRGAHGRGPRPRAT